MKNESRKKFLRVVIVLITFIFIITTVMAFINI